MSPPDPHKKPPDDEPTVNAVGYGAKLGVLGTWVYSHSPLQVQKQMAADLDREFDATYGKPVAPEGGKPPR